MIPTLVLCLCAQSIGLEAQGGLVAPGTPETDTPGVVWDLRLNAGIFEDWGFFVSVPFWSLSNFHPTSNPPGYLTGHSEMPFDYFGDYSEKHSGLLLGAWRRTGPVSVEASAGRYSRELMLYLSGVGKGGRPGEFFFDEEGLMASLALRVPVGNNAILSVGSRTEGFDHWYFTVSAGFSLTWASRGR